MAAANESKSETLRWSRAYRSTSVVTRGFPMQLSTHVMPGTMLTWGLPGRDCPKPMLFEFWPSTFKGNILSTIPWCSPIQHIPHYLPCSIPLFGKGLGSPKLSLLENRTHISFFRVLILSAPEGYDLLPNLRTLGCQSKV